MPRLVSSRLREVERNLPKPAARDSIDLALETRKVVEAAKKVIKQDGMDFR